MYKGDLLFTFNMNGENPFNKPMGSDSGKLKSKAEWQEKNTFYAKMTGGGEDEDGRIIWIVKATVSEDGETILYSSLLSLHKEKEPAPYRSMTLKRISD